MSEAAVRAYAEERHFSEGTLDRWLHFADADRDVLLRLAEKLRLGENQFRDVLDHLEDIAARKQCTLATVLESELIRSALESTQGRNETIKALKLSLRRLRYPQLAAAEQTLKELARRLALPAGVNVEFPENLEGEQVSVVLRARSAAQLRAQAAALASATLGSAIDEMFSLLEGDW